MRALRVVASAAAVPLLAVPAAAASQRQTIPVRAAPAVFRVGAAVEDINPTYPVYLGGYGGGPAGGTIARHVDPLTGRPENLTVRALAISSGGHVVELASVDSQGWFAGYQEGPYGITDVRDAVAGWLRSHGAGGAQPGDIIVSSLHEHAVPSLYGIYAPAPHQLPYLKQVAAATTRALEEAYQRAVPATITWGSANAPWLGGGDIGEGNEFEGWQRDGSLVALWARNARTGATVATYVSEPAYPNIVFGPADLVGTTARTLISTDFPSYAEADIESRLGGVAILASGSLANQASPMQADTAPSPDLPKIDGLVQTRAFDDIIQLGQAVAGASFLALAGGRVMSDATVAGDTQYLISPVTGPAVAGLTYGGVVDNGAPWAPITALTNIYPADRSVLPPYAYGAALGTWVTALRIGGLALVSEPGEFFGSIRAAWAAGIHAPDGVFAIGAAQDFLGYEYPIYVTPFTLLGGDELIFGPSATLGDQVVSAGERAAGQLGFAVNPTSNAEMSALDQHYARVAATGAYLLPSVTAGDLDAAGRFTPTLLAAGAPPRTSQTCDNPALLYSPPGCPLSDPGIGPFQWRFGDGTSLATPAQGRARAYFSPFVRHSYDRPGIYQVSVSVSSDGSTDAVSLPVTVYPRLEVAAIRSGDRLTARVSGGDGRVLVERWSLPGRPAVYGPSVSLAPGRPAVLTVVDGTGTAVTLAVW
ncbi:MAG: PKD domain-containing protein [Mycobacteriales bacterium]